MKTKATVVEIIDPDIAVVSVERRAACDGCHKQAEGECSVCSLMASGKTMKARAYNAVGAAVGDTVVLESSSACVLGYAALVFLLPIVAVIGGYLLAGLWTDVQTWRYVCAGVLFVLSFVVIRLISSCHAKRAPDIVAVAVIDAESGERYNEE